MRDLHSLPKKGPRQTGKTPRAPSFKDLPETQRLHICVFLFAIHLFIKFSGCFLPGREFQRQSYLPTHVTCYFYEEVGLYSQQPYALGRRLAACPPCAYKVQDLTPDPETWELWCVKMLGTVALEGGEL